MKERSMTIAKIEATLTNGFHDAFLERLSLDYMRCEARLDVSVWTGDLDAHSEELREARRKGVLTVTGLLYCVMDPPDARSFRQEAEGLWIADSGSVDNAGLSAKLPHPLPEGAFAHYFFINDWNAFIILVAKDAHFDWC
jgi:hypothetical protein